VAERFLNSRQETQRKLWAARSTSRRRRWCAAGKYPATPIPANALLPDTTVGGKFGQDKKTLDALCDGFYPA